MGKTAITAWVITVAAAAISIYFYQSLQAERDRSALLDARVAELEQSANSSPSTHDQPLATQIDDASSGETAIGQRLASNAQTDATPPTPRGDQGRNELRDRPNDPASRAVRRAQVERQLMERFVDLAATLKLQPHEAEKLFDLLADQQIATMDLRESLRAQNLPREELTKQLRQSNTVQEADTKQKIAALLGNAKAEEWQSYESSLGARMQIRELSMLLGSAGMPIRDDQTQPMIDALAFAQNRYNAEQPPAFNQFSAGPRSGDPSQRITMTEQSIARQEQLAQLSHDALAPHLNNAQLERYDEIQNQQIDAQRLNLQRLRQRSANSSPR